MAAATGKRAANRAQMRRHLALRDRENLTYKELAARTGVKVPTLARWQRVFRQEEAASFPSTPTESSPSSPFVELVVSSEDPCPPPPTRHFEVTIAGHPVKVPFDFDAGALTRLIRTLRQSC